MLLRLSVRMLRSSSPGQSSRCYGDPGEFRQERRWLTKDRHASCRQAIVFGHHRCPHTPIPPERPIGHHHNAAARLCHTGRPKQCLSRRGARQVQGHYTIRSQANGVSPPFQ